MEYAKIPTFGKYGKGKYMLVDIEDIPTIACVRWYVSWNGYATNRSRINGKNTNLRAHRVVMGPPKNMDVDHINHNKLDNRKSNLRICTRSQNLQNRFGLKGYYYSKKRDRWIVDNKFLGVRHKQFRTEKEAIELVNNLMTKSKRTK